MKKPLEKAEEVKTLAVVRANALGLDKDKRLRDKNDECYNNLQKLAV